jgi:hypothetical protein
VNSRGLPTADELAASRLTSPQNRGTQSAPTATAKKPATAASAAQTTMTPTAKVVADFLSKVKADKGKDAGKRPGFAQRNAVASQWGALVLTSTIGSFLVGKDYELARTMLEHYMTADGDPLIYTPPTAVQDAIRKKFTAPGHFIDVSGYAAWGTPDIRNGLGHFNLDVVKDEQGLTYFVTDRYEFPDKVEGRVVRHGFQVGKLSKATIDSTNAKLSALGEFKRDSGSLTEKFELQQEPKTGDCTFFVPQQVLVDNGTDFDSMGMFTVRQAKQEQRTLESTKRAK